MTDDMIIIRVSLRACRVSGSSEIAGLDIIIIIRHKTVPQGTACTKTSPIKCNKIKTYKPLYTIHRKII